MNTATDLPPPATLNSDSTLIADVLARQPGAFERVMRLHNRRLFRAARSILRDDSEAEEAVQEGYISAYHALAGFKGQSSLSTWLTRIVVNKALARRRGHAAQGEVCAAPPDEAHTSPTESPEAQAMRGELRRLIEASVDALPEQSRSVFMLRAVEEMSVAETAASLCMSEAAVKTALFRARRQLRDRIGDAVGPAIDEFFAFDGARCDRLVEAVRRRLGLAPPG